MHLFLRNSLNDKIYNGLLERWNAFEATKSCNDSVTDFNIFARLVLRLAGGNVKDLKPLVIKGFDTWKSFLLIYDEELADEVLALIRNCIEFSVLEMIVGFLNLLEHFGRVVSLERQVSTHQGVEEYTQWPNIGFLLVATFEYLRGHVVWSAREGRQIFVVARSYWETEINKLHFISLGDNDIFGHYISMHDILRVTMVDCI